MRIQIFFALMFFANILSAAELSSCNLVFSQDYYTIAAIGLIISILLLALRYMLGMLFASPDVEASVKVELWQIIATLGIMIFIPVIPLVLCSIDFNSKGIVDGNSITGAKSDLLMRIKSSADVYLEVAHLIHESAATGTMQFGFALNKLYFFFSPLSGYSSIAQVAAPIAQTAITTYFAAVGYYTVYVITQSKSFLLLIPIGIVLRCFPITRKIGGTLLAVGIGLVYIFPLIISIDSAIFPPFSPSDFDIVFSLDSSSLGLSPLELIFSSGVAFFGAMTAAGIYVSLISAITTIEIIIGSISLILGTGTLVGIPKLGPVFDVINAIATGGMMSIMSDVYIVIANVAIVVFFIPALELILISSIIRSLSSTLGSEIDIGGILRVV